jgi:hypothetical protein
MEYPSYAYLHCDLLDIITITTIALRVKSPHIEIHEEHLQKNMFMIVENFNIESKLKRGFKKRGSTTIVSLIPAFQLS